MLTEESGCTTQQTGVWVKVCDESFAKELRTEVGLFAGSESAVC